MYKYNHLNHFQIGKLGEYWAKIHLTLLGYDIYTSEVDDKGIDFIVRMNSESYIDIQVKTVRSKTNYVFVTKESWKNKLRNNLFLILILLEDDHLPEMFYIPAIDWASPNELLKDRNYLKPGQTSKPEWGINISGKNKKILKKYNSFNPK